MRPFVLNYAVARKGTHNPIYQYSFKDAMSVVESDQGQVKFIDISSNELSMITKTKVKPEADDDSLSLLEMTTKTQVKQERDDDSRHLLELQTKTFVKQESDD